MVQELFQAIESQRFAALVNVVSGYKAFVRALNQQIEVQQLRAQMESPEVRAAVVSRVGDLSAAESDPGYEHPADTAVAVYLLLLSEKDPEQARIASARLPGQGFWWARKVAETLASLPAPDTNGTQAAVANSPEQLEAKTP